MRVVFRVDSSQKIGSGHLMRCLTLAKALKAKGTSVCFISREHEGHLCELIEQQNFQIFRLPKVLDKEVIENGNPYLSWLECSWEEDANNTIGAIEAWGTQPDWLIVDHYALDIKWEQRLRKYAKNIMIIDDLFRSIHDCDLLLNQNLLDGNQRRYVELVPFHCSLLLGPKYALLQQYYRNLRSKVSLKIGPIKRILIFFGWVDRYNVTGRVLSALLNLDIRTIQIDIVMGASSPYLAEMSKKINGRENITLYTNMPTLALLLMKADLAIGAGGTTSWERLCLGVPTLLISIANNQCDIARSLDGLGLVIWLGDQNAVSEKFIEVSVKSLIEKGLNEVWSQNCRNVVDGEGARRVCAALMSSAHSQLFVRRATPTDSSLLLDWVNDELTRKNSINSDHICANSHELWFNDSLSRGKERRIYIIETNSNIPIGQVRFDRQNGEWNIGYSLAKTFRGKGLGRKLLGKGMQKLAEEEGIDMPLLGAVKMGNYASCKVFESLGFNSIQKGDLIEYRRSIKADSFQFS